jgi:hypothetical protein
VRADGDFLAANENFLRAWGQGRIDDAIAYLDASCVDCFNIYRREDQAPSSDWDEVRAQWKEGLKRLSDRLGRSADIHEVIGPVDVAHPRVRLVGHDFENSYTIMSLPDDLAEQYNCTKMANNEVTFQRPAESVYGNYFASAIRFRLEGEEPAVLYLIWNRVNDNWKITSYAILRP